MKSNQEQLSLIAAECTKIGPHQPARDVVVERLFIGAHSVIEHSRFALNEGDFKKVLRLPAQSSLKDGRHPPSKIRQLRCNQLAVVAVAEEFAERGKTSE